MPTVVSLATPGLWIFGDQDSSMPSGDSIEKLTALQQQGLPIVVGTVADAGHGILRFEGESTSDRRYLGYAPGYLDLQVQWLRRQSDLPELPRRAA